MLKMIEMRCKQQHLFEPEKIKRIFSSLCLSGHDACGFQVTGRRIIIQWPMAKIVDALDSMFL